MVWQRSRRAIAAGVGKLYTVEMATLYLWMFLQGQFNTPQLYSICYASSRLGYIKKLIIQSNVILLLANFKSDECVWNREHYEDDSYTKYLIINIKLISTSKENKSD
jgi:hypothetical protein